MPNLKYEEEIKEYPYDLSEFSEREVRKAYRWVFEDINDTRNFLPVYVLSPNRITKNYTCTGWALSVYETKDQAKERLDFLMKNDPKIYLKLGTHTAEGTLLSDDGISDDASTSPRGRGHFNHFEYQDVELASKFNVIDCLVQV